MQDTPPPTVTFNAWAAGFLDAPEEERARRMANGVALARAHRVAIKELIIRDPRRALEQAIPMVVRQQLPPEVVTQLEERVSTRAFYGVLAVPQGSGVPPIRREVRTDDRKFDAFVFGRRMGQATTENALITGIAVDRALAVDERPLRVLESGEIPDIARTIVETCPISKKSTLLARESDRSLPPVSQQTPAVEVAGTIHYLCTGSHIGVFEEGLIAQEGSTGGPTKPGGPIPSSYTTGVKKHLYIRVTFPDQLVDPQSERDAYEMMRQVNDFMVENSFGQCYFITTVTPLIVLPRSVAWYDQEDDSGAVLADARTAARALGYDPSQYDFDTVRYTGGPGSFGGQAYVGGKGCWLKSSSVGVACHEYGHNLGLWHANYWNTSPASAIGPGTNAEYGNSFDTMGAASAGNNHFTAYHKHILSWLKDDVRTHVLTSGTYRIFSYDQPVVAASRRYALKIVKDRDRDYWIEFRTKFTSNQWFNNGLLFNWSSWGDDAATGSNGGGQLLDMTPGSADGKNDSALVIGRTFSDGEAGIHVTPIGKGGTTPESFDVVVNLGDFPGNQKPTLSITASATNVAVNSSVILTATAGDADGDQLAYAWDFGDKSIGANAPNATKAWPTAGKYVVRCSASDMKGEVATRFVVVSVGTTSTFTISGRVTGPAGAPIEGVLVSNGASGSSFRGSYTDDLGDYIITGLAAGTHTITPRLSGYAFTPAGFNNPVAVGPDAVGKNFTAAATPTVAIMAADVLATETAGNLGVFRISRTGSTGSALVVRVFNATGSATRGTDYTLTPDPVANAGVYEITIPAGAATLDVTLTPAQDSTTEGVETATLQMLPTTAYLISGSQQATIEIADDETSLPVVNLVASDIGMNEAGETATLLVNRTGSTVAPLNVLFTFSGIAVLGTDFGSASSVTIPAGASSAPIVLTPINDSSVEGNETTTLTLANNAAYRRGLQQAQAIVLNDDDVNVVTATATDNAAAESGDTGTFTITRIGDPAAALTVHFTLGGSAHHGTDFLSISGVATIAAGEASTTVTVVPVDDAIGEGHQTVILQLRSETSYLNGTPNQASINISDDDLPTVLVTPSDGTASEPAAGATFRIRRTGNNATFTLHYKVSGTATPGSDYTTLSGTVDFAAADTSKDVTVTPIDDSEVEDAETITLTITPDPAYSLTPEESATIALLDDEQVMVSVSTEDRASVAENAGSARFWLSRSGATTNALTVSYALSGSATNGADYGALSGTAIIPAGASGVYITVTATSDTLKEGSETVTISIAGGAGYGARLGAATYYITDDDGALPTTVRFNASSSTVTESAGNLDVAVSLLTASAETVTVHYAISGGSATGEGVDYSLSSGVLTFAPGETAKNISVTITDDIFIEGTETATVALTHANGASLATSIHTLTIADNDTAPAPTIGFVGASSSAPESVSAPQTILVSLSAAATSAITVEYAVSGGSAASGTDYMLVSGTLSFAAGDLVQHVPIAVIDDGALETNETVSVALNNATGAALTTNAAHTFTIIDDDAARITVVATDNAAGEDGVDTATLTFTRMGTFAADLVIDFTVTGTATIGSDFTSPGTSVRIPAAEASTTLTITPLEDTAYDPDETVVITVSPNANYTVASPGSATVTISDNDIGVNVSANDANAGEPSDAGQVSISRAGGAVGDLVVTLGVAGTATAGTDYVELPATVTISDGQTSVPLLVNVIDDAAVEPVETIIINVTAGDGYSPYAPASATVSINDDDANVPPGVTINSPVAANVNIPFGVGLVLEAVVLDDGKPIAPGKTTAGWTKLSGPGVVTFGNPASANTTAAFSTAGTYVLRLTVSDGEFTRRKEVTVFVGGAAATWTSTNIGGVTPAGSGAETIDGTFTVLGAGGTITSGSTTDGFFYYHQPVSGDFDVAAFVESISAGASASARSGLMCRADTGIGASHAFMGVTNNRTSFVYRTANGGSSGASNTDQAASVPRWVRLRRQGNSLSAFHSSDGSTWTQQGSSQTIALGNPVRLGFAVTSANSGALHAAVFGALQVVPPALGGLRASSNLAPQPNAGTDAAVHFPEPGTLDGSIVDDSRPAPPGVVISTWSKVSGPAGVSFANEDAAETAVTFDAIGTYVLRLTADDGQVKTFDDVTLTSTLPAVSITAADPTGSEFGSEPARFIVSRSGGTGNNLTVKYAVSGTALNGTDYGGLTSTVTLTSGSATATIDILPLGDSLAEGSESVDIALEPSDQYGIGLPAQATAAIEDLPFDSWRFARFGAEANNAAVAGDLANPDRDLLVNLAEYSTGSDPLVSDTIDLALSQTGTEFSLVYPRSLAAADVSVSVEWTEDLQTWRTDGVTDVELPNDGTMASRRATVTAPGDHCYMRLRVTR